MPLLSNDVVLLKSSNFYPPLNWWLSKSSRLVCFLKSHIVFLQTLEILFKVIFLFDNPIYLAILEVEIHFQLTIFLFWIGNLFSKGHLFLFKLSPEQFNLRGKFINWYLWCLNSRQGKALLMQWILHSLYHSVILLLL